MESYLHVNRSAANRNKVGRYACKHLYQVLIGAGTFFFEKKSPKKKQLW